MPKKSEINEENNFPGAQAILMCADLLVARGCREKAAKVLDDCMTNSVKRFWSKSLDDWIVDPDYNLRAKVAMGVAHLIDGSPVTRKEVRAWVVNQSHSTKADGKAANLDDIKDPVLKETLTKLLGQYGATTTVTTTKTSTTSQPGAPAGASSDGAEVFDAVAIEEGEAYAGPEQQAAALAEDGPEKA